MNDLALHIEYLLLRHDCVVVPGLGAFLTHREEAYIDEQTSMIMPPSRQLGFNSDVRLNDGLLAQSVASKEHMDMDSAARKIAGVVNEFVRSLQDCPEARIGNLGKMSMHEGTLVFVPDAENTVDLSCRGLHAFRLEPLPAEHPMEPIDEDKAKESAPHMPAWLKVAASVMVLFMTIGIVVATSDIAVNQRTAQAGLDSGLRHSIEYAMPDEEHTLPLSRQIDLLISAPVPEATEVATSTATKPAVKPMRYILVVGSFPTAGQARRYMSDFDGLDVIEMDGNYRVYAAQASTISQANSLADSLRQAYPSVWVCRR